LGRKKQRFSGTNQKPELLRPFGTGLLKPCPQGLLLSYLTLLRSNFSRPFRLFPGPTNCPWVSEDDGEVIPGFFSLTVKIQEHATDLLNRTFVLHLFSLKAARYEIRDTKTLNLSRNIVSLQVLVDVSRFSPFVINLPRICCGLKKVVAKSGVYFVQQILAMLLVLHQTNNLARNKYARALANQPIRALHFFDRQQMFLLRIKLITHGEKRETSTKTCNETMLRDRLKVFVSRISPPLIMKGIDRNR